ncbi:MAG: 50S ribosomal protein L23 [Alphaproteobacteria bacterium]|nr:50S ribosomal protein L23 [Alphaproteobacteria bacterium]
MMKSKEKKAKQKEGKEKKRLPNEKSYGVLLSPVITEKATLGSEHNQITFRVPLKATKPEIKDAVERLFDVKVVAVNTLRQQGKTKRFKGQVGKRAAYKKAMVTLAEGHAVDVTTGI